MDILEGDGYQIRERLDQALVSSDWTLLFLMARLFHKSSSVSNQSLLLVKFFEDQNRDRHKRFFRFESIWLKDLRCDSIVTTTWNEGLSDTSPQPILSCLNLCRAKLEAWNEFGHVGREIARLQKHLEWLEMQPTDSGIIQNIRKTRIELNYWIDKENTMWKQRSRLDWFRERDRNTKFFHVEASSWFQKNTIEGILNSQEVW